MWKRRLKTVIMAATIAYVSSTPAKKIVYDS